MLREEIKLCNRKRDIEHAIYDRIKFLEKLDKRFVHKYNYIQIEIEYMNKEIAAIEKRLESLR